MDVIYSTVTTVNNTELHIWKLLSRSYTLIISFLKKKKKKKEHLTAPNTKLWFYLKCDLD